MNLVKFVTYKSLEFGNNCVLVVLLMKVYKYEQ